MLTIILPTRNEELSIKSVIKEIALAKPPPPYEVLVVDDSIDNTAEMAADAGARVIKGQNKGLGQAIIDGTEASRGDIVLIMDADGQHDPKDIPRLVSPLMNGVDFTVGSRYINGGSEGDWVMSRRIVSKVARLCALPITGVKDATSGYCSFRKDILNGHKIEASSWKIMLEVLVKTHPKNVREVPIRFRKRVGGESKFNRKEMVAYLSHLTKLALYKYRMLSFIFVGGIGYVVNMALYYPMILLFQSDTNIFGQHFYLPPFLLSSLAAITSNYYLNKRFTFGDRHTASFGYWRYLSMALITLVADTALLAFMVDVLSIPPVSAAAVAILLVFIARYGVAKRWIWRVAKSKPDGN